MIYINTGVPINAVKIPIGNSAGATIVLAAISAAVNKAAPKMADPGITKRLSDVKVILKI